MTKQKFNTAVEVSKEDLWNFLVKFCELRDNGTIPSTVEVSCSFEGCEPNDICLTFSTETREDLEIVASHFTEPSEK